jgi:hypothetical protein
VHWLILTRQIVPMQPPTSIALPRGFSLYHCMSSGAVADGAKVNGRGRITPGHDALLHDLSFVDVTHGIGTSSQT